MLRCLRWLHNASAPQQRSIVRRAAARKGTFDFIACVIHIADAARRRSVDGGCRSCALKHIHRATHKHTSDLHKTDGARSKPLSQTTQTNLSNFQRANQSTLLIAAIHIVCRAMLSIGTAKALLQKPGALNILMAPLRALTVRNQSCMEAALVFMFVNYMRQQHAAYVRVIIASARVLFSCVREASYNNLRCLTTRMPRPQHICALANSSSHWLRNVNIRIYMLGPDSSGMGI